MAHPAASPHDPAIRKRGGDPEVKNRHLSERPDDATERKLEQGLEESMAGSDPVSITQPPKSKTDHDETKKER